MTVAQDLKAARARISGKGSWCKFHDIHIDADGKPSYCALGAMLCNALLYAIGLQVYAVASVLRQRWLRGELPIPIYSGGGAAPIPWPEVFLSSGAAAIAQFNNSTSQAEVLALFDEAIEAELAKEAADRPKLVDLTPPAKTRELEPA